MFGVDNFFAFLIAGILLNITPGSDTMYVLGRSISQGKKAGIYSALGIGTGCIVHIFLATFGLSLIIKESEMLFNVIKYLGAGYLFYLGVRMWLNRSGSKFDVSGADDIPDLKRVFLSGALTNILNPKVAVFFIAFLPQFVQADYPHPAIPFFILGFTFNFTGTVWNLILALFASTMTRKIKDNYRFKTWLDRMTGSVFILLGIKLALQNRR
jgi:RhtB (resistance to homoserine/threonine) family protein